MKKSHHDIVIIGGGIIGGAIAYYCAKAGLDITILEKMNLRVVLLLAVMAIF